MNMWFLFFFCVVVIVSNSPVSAAEGALLQSANLEWSQISNKGESWGIAPVGDERGAGTRASEMNRLLLEAQGFRAFSQKYPNDTRSTDAKRREALLLQWAALLGDDKNEDRRRLVVQDVRASGVLMPQQKFEVVAWAGQVEVLRQRLTTREQRLSAQEGVTRALIIAFPSVPDGYDSLLAIGADSEASKARTIAGEVLASQATESSKGIARSLMRRLDLINVPLSSALGAGKLEPMVGGSDGEATVVYSWSMRAPRSLSICKQVAKWRASINLVGICLDPDTPEVRAWLANQNVPGKHHFDVLGVQGTVAQAFGIDRPGLVYMANKEGVVTDIRGHIDTKRKIAALSQ